MKTLKLTSAWILICSLTAVTCGPSEHASSHHVVQHGANTPQKTHPDTIAPMGVQIPDHVLSTQDVSCISADNNIFQIMQEAQKACNGSDMSCTFYHFVNHGYQNIGTLDVNKELFDDLLMKFDNWLLTAESIDKAHAIGKTNEHSPIITTSVLENNKYKNEGRVEDPTDTFQGKLDDNISKSDVDRDRDMIEIHGHHNKNPDETHHRNHHHKLKNGNHTKPHMEYNKEHKYFEVFLPKDRETGKPRTIYVEIDKDRNEFILLDEDIDKKLNGIKPIQIELDELSDIADTAFSNLVKSSHHKGHIHNNINNHNQVTVSDLNANSTIDKSELQLDIGKDEYAQNILNSSVCDPHICNSNASQPLILNNSMENVKNILNVSENLQEQFDVEPLIDNTTEDTTNNNFEILENINETDIHETGFYEKEYLDTVEFDHNNITDLDIDADYLELNSSHEFINIPCENEDDNCTEHRGFSTDHDIVTYDDNDYIQLEEHNDTNNDIDFDDTQELLSTETIDLNEPILQDDMTVQETKTKTIPYEPILTSSLTDGISSSQFHLLPPENQKTLTDQYDQSSVSNVPIKPFTAIPILGQNLAKVVEKNSHLQFPLHATAEIYETDSQNPILNSDSHLAVSPRDYILPLPNKKFSGSPKSISPNLSIPTKDSSIFQIAPSFNIDIQEPCLSTAPFQLVDNTPMSTKNTILPSKFASPKSLGNIGKITPSNQFEGSFLSATPYNLQQVSPNFLPTKDNLGLVKCLPMDDDIKETMIPYSANKNRYPCNTIAYCSNPYLKPPQLIPSYYEPPPHVTPLQPTSKIPTVDSLPMSFDQSNICFNSEYPRETKPIPLVPFAPNAAPFSPLNQLWLEPSAYPNLWNNIPYQTAPSLPYSILPAQNIWNYPPILSNYLAPNIGQQQNQILKPLPSNEVPKSLLQLPCECPTKNILQMTPSSNTIYSPIYTRPIQIGLNPSLNLERDLQTLSCKYGIPLTKILDALDAEISSTDNKISWLPFGQPRSKFLHDSFQKGKSEFSATNAVDNHKNRPDDKDLIESDLTNLTPLDSNLIGTRLEIDNSLLLGPDDLQTYTVASETTGPPRNQHLNLNKNPDNKYQEILTGNIQLGDEDRIANVKLHQESDSSNLVPLDSSLIGPHLKISSPPVVLDSNKSDIHTSYTEVPVTSLDNSLVHLKTESPAKPLLSDEIQITDEMIPLESDITGLTPLDSSHVQVINELKQSEISQHKESATTVDTTILYKPVETEPNFIEGVLLPESDSSKLIPLDSSLIGTHLEIGNLSIITNASEDKSESLQSDETIEISDNKVDETDSIILPSSMLSTLLSKPVNADLNIATHSHNIKLNNLLETNLEHPVPESSSITTSVKETDFQIIEPNLEIKNSTILEDKSKPTDITLEINSETQLDSSLIGPNLLQEIDSREMSPILDSADHFETYEAVPTSKLNKRPLKFSAAVDSTIQYCWISY